MRFRVHSWWDLYAWLRYVVTGMDCELSKYLCKVVTEPPMHGMRREGSLLYTVQLCQPTVHTRPRGRDDSLRSALRICVPKLPQLVIVCASIM